MKRRYYILYDERALHDTNAASVFEAGITSLSEAKKWAEDYGGVACYSYWKCGRYLTDERLEFWGRYNDEGQYITTSHP